MGASGLGNRLGRSWSWGTDGGEEGAKRKRGALVCLAGITQAGEAESRKVEPGRNAPHPPKIRLCPALHTRPPALLSPQPARSHLGESRTWHPTELVMPQKSTQAVLASRWLSRLLYAKREVSVPSRGTMGFSCAVPACLAWLHQHHGILWGRRGLHTSPRLRGFPISPLHPCKASHRCRSPGKLPAIPGSHCTSAS